VAGDLAKVFEDRRQQGDAAHVPRLLGVPAKSWAFNDSLFDTTQRLEPA
jgi:hypothetical protein